MKYSMSLAALALAMVFSSGCGESPTSGTPATQANYKSAPLCNGCGQIKGTAVCCAEGAEACAGCKLHKGAPGCCKIEDGVQLIVCGGCGEIKGTEVCCAEGCEACTACGLHKGSPGCCNLEKTGTESEGPAGIEKSDPEMKEGNDKEIADCGECEGGDDHDHDDHDHEEIV
jgi:hypothetical protein